MAATYDLRAFSRDWAEARAKFVDAARRAGAAHRAWPHPLKGPGGEALCTDTAWLGPRDASRVLVVIAGTHGVEGFCGSGPMIGLLRGDAALGLPPDTGVLLIHGINPHGWAWLRRVTEENVDLNRNWVDFDAPRPANPGYAALHAHLVPASRSSEASTVRTRCASPRRAASTPTPTAGSTAARGPPGRAAPARRSSSSTCPARARSRSSTCTPASAPTATASRSATTRRAASACAAPARGGATA
jgi:hypothetical protein